tara:strand:+ start:589 stop:840 length:252 start_codon:yes stop_codon:yes gene_type:complete
MTLYSCECGKESKEIPKATIVLRDGKWVTKEAECSCGKFMESKPTEGIPNLKRTEPSLTKKSDKLWAGAKEKLIGERGINEDY